MFPVIKSVSTNNKNYFLLTSKEFKLHLNLFYLNDCKYLRYYNEIITNSTRQMYVFFEYFWQFTLCKCFSENKRSEKLLSLGCNIKKLNQVTKILINILKHISSQEIVTKKCFLRINFYSFIMCFLVSYVKTNLIAYKKNNITFQYIT